MSRDTRSGTISSMLCHPARGHLSRAKTGLGIFTIRLTSSAASANARDHPHVHGEPVIRASLQRPYCLIHHRRRGRGHARRAGAGPPFMPNIISPASIASRTPCRRPMGVLSHGSLPSQRLIHPHRLHHSRVTNGSCLDWRAKWGRPHPRTRALFRAFETYRRCPSSWVGVEDGFYFMHKGARQHGPKHEEHQ